MDAKRIIEEHLLTMKEASDVSGFTVANLHARIKDKSLACIRKGRDVFILRGHAEKLKDRRLKENKETSG